MPDSFARMNISCSFDVQSVEVWYAALFRNIIERIPLKIIASLPSSCFRSLLLMETPLIASLYALFRLMAAITLSDCRRRSSRRSSVLVNAACPFDEQFDESEYWEANRYALGLCCESEEFADERYFGFLKFWAVTNLLMWMSSICLRMLICSSTRD